jgi:8-oxo-dGTP pyrophosphatase MutT (NUDIX family)
MHTVYINNKPLIFSNIYSSEYKSEKEFNILSESEFPVESIAEVVEKKSAIGFIYLCSDPGKAWKNFADRFILIEAAGGLVLNEQNEILFIFRKKMWDLPKGKLDYDESPEQAAVREVMEECGLSEVKSLKELTKTFHTYTEKNKFILKKTHWFLMSASSNEKLTPQSGEYIEQAVWMNEKRMRKDVFPLTYGSIRDVLNSYFKN